MKKNGFLIFLCLFNCLTISHLSLAMEKNSEDESVNLGKRKFDDSDSPNPVSSKVAKTNDDKENSIANDHCITIADLPPEIFVRGCSYLSTTDLIQFREVINYRKFVSMIDSEACSMECPPEKRDYKAYLEMITQSFQRFERVTIDDFLKQCLNVENPCSRRNTFVNCIFHDLPDEVDECKFEQCEFMDACAGGEVVGIVNSYFNKCTFKETIRFDIDGFVNFKDCVLDEVDCCFHLQNESSGITLKGCKINMVVFRIDIKDKRTDEQILEQLRIAGAVWNVEMPPRIARA